MLKTSLIPICSVLLVVWIGLCTYWNRQCCLNPNNPDGSILSDLRIMDGDNLIADAPSSIAYSYASDKQTISKEAKTALVEVITYLKEHPAKLLVLTGKATSEENKISEIPNLGKIRAYFLREEFIELGVVSYQIATIGIVEDSLQKINGHTIDAIAFSFRDYPLRIEDGSDFVLAVNDNMRFAFSDLFPTYSDEVKEGLQRLATYLKNNPKKVLSLVGYYASQEANDSSFEDLGLARANAVKNILLDFGASDNNILISSSVFPASEVFDAIVIGGVVFSF
jgi:outer membrane protein OmpA-like peptidoglycan-associated protein